jgi:hypothetical protein
VLSTLELWGLQWSWLSAYSGHSVLGTLELRGITVVMAGGLQWLQRAGYAGAVGDYSGHGGRVIVATACRVRWSCGVITAAIAAG